jgi:uncharacterized protein YbaR (Trm112 family)
VPGRPQTLARVALGTLADGVGEVRAYGRERRRHRPRPPAEGLVIEVGGGHAPHPRSDLIVEKYLSDDFERGFAVSFDRPLVVGDGHALPLADGCASYVIASHVLEHATDPERFAAELTRVAHAGFVQLPSRLAELTFGWPFHPWLVDLEPDGTLVFHERDGRHAPAGEYFHESFARSPFLRLWWNAHRSHWHHTVEWEDRLEVRQAAGTSRAEETAVFDREGTERVLRDAGERGALSPLPAHLWGVLRCPEDSAALRREAGAAICTGCDRRYPVVADVPLLVTDAAG